MMSPAQLADLLLSPLLSAHMDTMVTRMAAAMAYHRNTETAISDILKYRHGNKLLTTRLYTQDKYCASLSVDYFLQVKVNECTKVHRCTGQELFDALTTDCIRQESNMRHLNLML